MLIHRFQFIRGFIILGLPACAQNPTLVIENGRVIVRDGTDHGVLNALTPDFDRAALAVLPLGTANDFARSLSLPLEVSEAVEAGVLRIVVAGKEG